MTASLFSGGEPPEQHQQRRTCHKFGTLAITDVPAGLLALCTVLRGRDLVSKTQCRAGTLLRCRCACDVRVHAVSCERHDIK